MNAVSVPVPWLRARATSPRAGFTLIEVLVSIAIVSILVAIVVPRIDLDRYKVQAATRSVTSTLTYAQRLAVSLQHDVRVSFDSANNRLRIHEDADNNGIMDPGERVTYTPLDNGVTFGLGATPAFTFGAATFNLTRTEAGLPCVIFRRDGSASEYGGFYLNGVKAVAQGDMTKTRAGEIIRSSGRVVWYSYATGAWLQGN